MQQAILTQFSTFLANWSLDEETIPALLGRVPRKATAEDWTIGWSQGKDGLPTLLIGRGFQNLSEQGQRAYTQLVINQLLLGHLETDFAWNSKEEDLCSYLWQAFLFLPEYLQNHWGDWSPLKRPASEPSSRVLLVDLVRKEAIVTRFPELLILARQLQRYWSYTAKENFNQQLLRKELLQSLSQQSGTLSGRWQIIVEENRRLKANFPWPLLLRNHLKRFLKSTVQATSKRPSKRYGTIPGLRVVGRAKIGVVLDTSGSVDVATLALFQKEIKKIAGSGHQVEVLEADSRIQKKYLFQGSLPTVLHGRGGTNYDPAIQYLEEKAKADLILYFTDGLGPPPQHWKKAPLIWLIYADADQQTILKTKQADWPGNFFFVDYLV